MPRYIDVDAFRKENRMAEHCEDCERNSRECQYNDFSMMDFCGWLDDAPTVDAVPLEPLCQWLAGYAAPPQYAMNAVAGDPIVPTSCGYPVNSRVEAWKYHFRELLKSGLMDTEGEDAEEKA